ncbi:MAG: thiamine-binding protein [Firmicutes bacterium]|nr:thiamine-binding protein [Bacillota bacterium]
MLNALVSIQVIPQAESGSNIIPWVDRAIELIRVSGLPYRVGPMETTLEGDLGQCLDLLQNVHAELVRLGCPSVIAQIKTYCPAPVGSLYQLTEKYN